MSKREQNKKPTTLKGSCLWGLLLFGVLLLIDMATKIAAVEYFSNPNNPDRVDIIPGWISLCITYNKGIAYGMGDSSSKWAKLAVIIGTAVLMAVFAVLYFKLDKNRGWARTAMVLIVAGGVGNLIDRVFYEVWDPNALYGVRDMVDLSRFGFAVCNFADFFISIGAVVLVLSLLFFDKDALFPVGKYKVMAQEIAELAETSVNGTTQEGLDVDDGQ